MDNCLTLESLTPTGSNTVTYANAFTATDLTYVLDNYGLKEYIILNSADGPNEFSFMFQLDGLEIQTIENETFFMNAEGKSVFQLGQLFAVDGADELTNELTYSFTPVKGTSNVIVTVTLSEDYLAAPDRVFPVVIDPSIMISSVQTADACVLSYYPDTNYYTSSYLRTGYDSDYGIRRSFIRFDIPSSIPEDSVTESLLYFEKCGGVAPTMRAHRCILPWESATLTWNNQPLYNTTHDLSYSPLAERYSSTSAWYKLDVTNIVKSWVKGQRTNYGFALVDITEDDEDHWTTYYSSDMESPHKPELHITYNGTEPPPETTDPTDPPVVTPTLTLYPSTMELDINSTGTLTATTSPSATVTWSSSNTSVATVSSTGKVTGKSLGTTTITASANGLTASCTVYVTIADGRYYIRNKASEKYVDIEDQNMANGTTIHQWDFHGGNTQKWDITHVGQAMYTIKSANSTTSYYLGVSGDSTAVDQPIVLRTGTPTNGMKWKIDVTYTGAYKLTPVSGENYGYVLAMHTGFLAGDQANGNDLKQKEYTGKDDYFDFRDEWFLETTTSFGVIHYYDEGFLIREPSAFQKLHEYNTAVAARFKSIFGIDVMATYVPYWSKADECKKLHYNYPSSTNLESPCPFMPTCLSTDVLRLDLTLNMGEGTNKTSIVLWTGHRMTDDIMDRSNSVSASHSVIMTPTNTWPADRNLSTTERRVVSIRTLLHELSHQFGAVDHYCYGRVDGGKCQNENCDMCNDDIGVVRMCVMGKEINIADYDDESLYCSECLAAIKAYLNEKVKL